MTAPSSPLTAMTSPLHVQFPGADSVRCTQRPTRQLSPMAVGLGVVAAIASDGASPIWATAMPTVATTARVRRNATRIMSLTAKGPTCAVTSANVHDFSRRPVLIRKPHGDNRGLGRIDQVTQLLGDGQ